MLAVFDFAWTPAKCISCNLCGKCKSCRYITTKEKVDLRSLCLYTELPELYYHFENMVSCSQITDAGYSFSGASVYLDSIEINQPPVTFWQIMIRFLHAKNEVFREKMNKKKGNK